MCPYMCQVRLGRGGRPPMPWAWHYSNAVEFSALSGETDSGSLESICCSYCADPVTCPFPRVSSFPSPCFLETTSWGCVFSKSPSRVKSTWRRFSTWTSLWRGSSRWFIAMTPWQEPSLSGTVSLCDQRSVVHIHNAVLVVNCLARVSNTPLCRSSDVRTNWISVQQSLGASELLEFLRQALNWDSPVFASQ